MKSKIQQYRFEDDKSRLPATVVGNAVLLFIFLFPEFDFWQGDRIYFLLLTVAVYLILVRAYDWTSRSLNFLWVVVYLAIVVSELIYLGVPSTPVLYDDEKYRLGKGIMMNILIGSLPVMYVLARMLLVLPLLLIAWRR